ncbi:hypothetical protein CKAH01_04886 [Colletotrichum kahawae]|uniref:Uncharacterized protein n=1 Tax=Colletotrichum kahawae TaxID=34407 RepID=A0AAE0D7E6_COLKA|nr:hypothetical protein CKAH01_04886 [Colletotrichum kahawae]
MESYMRRAVVAGCCRYGQGTRGSWGRRQAPMACLGGGIVSTSPKRGAGEVWERAAGNERRLGLADRRRRSGSSSSSRRRRRQREQQSQDESEGSRVEERQRDGVESEAETERQRLARGWHLSDEMRCDS